RSHVRGSLRGGRGHLRRDLPGPRLLLIELRARVVVRRRDQDVLAGYSGLRGDPLADGPDQSVRRAEQVEGCDGRLRLAIVEQEQARADRVTDSGRLARVANYRRVRRGRDVDLRGARLEIGGDLGVRRRRSQADLTEGQSDGQREYT